MPWLQLSKISLQIIPFSMACNDVVFLRTVKYLLLSEWQRHGFICLSYLYTWQLEQLNSLLSYYTNHCTYIKFIKFTH